MTMLQLFPTGRFRSDIYYDGNMYDVEWSQQMVKGQLRFEVISGRWCDIEILDMIDKSVVHFKDDFFEALLRRSRQIINANKKSTT
jgi:hypothetical protein